MLENAGLYAALWIAFHFGIGYIAYRLPPAFLRDLPFVSQCYRWETTGRLYERLGIRDWKDRLPEAGDFYAGGFSKRHLHGHDPAYLRRFVIETSRAETSHWLTWGMALTFFAWNPWDVGVAMMIYGAIANLPCILIQRYNRVRLRRAIRILARRADRDGAPLPVNAVAH